MRALTRRIPGETFRPTVRRTLGSLAMLVIGGVLVAGAAGASDLGTWQQFAARASFPLYRPAAATGTLDLNGPF